MEWQPMDVTLPKLDEILALDSGPRMDALIARWAFDKQVILQYNETWLVDGSGSAIPAYSGTNLHIFNIAGRPSPTGKGFFLHDSGEEGSENRWMCQFGESPNITKGSNWIASAYAPKPALAVCRARLAAARIEQDREADEEVERWMNDQGIVLGGES